VRIYVATSWRNEEQPAVVAALRADGHEVYDFRHPAEGDDGFSWREIDPDWQRWDPATYREALETPPARRGFNFDMDALRRCDACVLVQPCGRSAHLELGWAAGAGKRTAVLLRPGNEPELMLKVADRLVLGLPELRDVLRAWSLA
jgi:hypothetical protein